MFSNSDISALTTAFERMADAVNKRQKTVSTAYGIHGIVYGEDDLGYYGTVGFILPEEVFAEIEDGTYGTLQGFRFYYRRKEYGD